MHVRQGPVSTFAQPRTRAFFLAFPFHHHFSIVRFRFIARTAAYIVLRPMFSKVYLKTKAEFEKAEIQLELLKLQCEDPKWTCPPRLKETLKRCTDEWTEGHTLAEQRRFIRLLRGSDQKFAKALNARLNDFYQKIVLARSIPSPEAPVAEFVTIVNEEIREYDENSTHLQGVATLRQESNAIYRTSHALLYDLMAPGHSDLSLISSNTYIS